MASGAEVKITDTGWSLPADLLDLDGDEIQAGVLDGADAHGGIGTATLALIHEDGAPAARIPARPFMRPTFDQNADVYLDAVEDAVTRVIAGSSSAPLVAVADKVASDMRATIEQGRTGGPPLQPMSARRASGRRGGGLPLIDTGSLVAALQGQVVKSKGGGSRG